MKSKKVFVICRSAIIAAFYFVLPIAVPSLSFGTIQFRLSEALTLLPVIMPEAIFGLTVGCFFSNMFFSPFGIIDMAIGTSVTFIAAVLTYVLRKKIAVAALPPVLLNALFVPLIWIINGSDSLYYINMFSILISQAIVIYAIGLPLTIGLRKVLPSLIIKFGKKKKSKEDDETLQTLNDKEAKNGDVVETSFDSDNNNQDAEKENSLSDADNGVKTASGETDKKED